jgi:anti-anti-sigma factor
MEIDLLTLDLRREAARVVLVVRGDLDMRTVAPLRQALAGARQHPPCDLVVDLSEVTFFDAQTLGPLAATARWLRDRGCRTRLVGLVPWQEKVVRSGRLAQLLGPDSGHESLTSRYLRWFDPWLW